MRSILISVSVILLIFIFSPLAAGDSQPSFFEMKQFYYDKFGKPDHIVVEFCLSHPGRWVKRTYLWEYKFVVVFLWRPKIGWQILGMQSFVPRSA